LNILIILKEIISQHEEISELLCSYFLKTTLFWVIEETQRSIWDPKYMMLCFHLCLERLMQFIIEDNCPNYFCKVRINTAVSILSFLFCDVFKSSNLYGSLK
jgi:hypothetical protein